MNILVVSQYFYPEQFRLNDICFDLVKRGHNVTVLTGQPNYPGGEIYDEYLNNPRTEEIINGVKVIRCQCRPRHKGLFNLFLNYISFVIKGKKCIKKIKNCYDVIYVYGVSPITLALPAIKYAKTHHIPLYFYCLDLWPESVRELSSSHVIGNKNPLFILTKLLSKYIYKKCDCIGVKCEEFVDYLVNVCKVDASKIKILYEHAEDIYLKVNSKPIDNGVFDFVFLGNIGNLQNCSMFVEAISKLTTDKNVKLHFVGDGSDIDNVKNKVKELKVEDKVVFHGKVPVNEVIKYYEFADCCLLSLSDRTACGLTLPAKLTGYMAAARPIIASATGATKSIIESAKCGYCSKYNDLDSLIANMNKIMQNEDINLLGINGRNYFVNSFTLDNHISKLLLHLKRIIL